jgi:hypothetical protein
VVEDHPRYALANPRGYDDRSHRSILLKRADLQESRGGSTTIHRPASDLLSTWRDAHTPSQRSQSSRFRVAIASRARDPHADNRKRPDPLLARGDARARAPAVAAQRCEARPRAPLSPSRREQVEAVRWRASRRPVRGREGVGDDADRAGAAGTALQIKKTPPTSASAATQKARRSEATTGPAQRLRTPPRSRRGRRRTPGCRPVLRADARRRRS